MKFALLTLLFVPLFSFSQVSRKDKKNIDKYAINLCDCVDGHMSTLHPKAVEVVRLMGEKGQEEAMKDVEVMISAMDPADMKEFLEAFNIMESEEFQKKVEACDQSDQLSSELKEQIDNGEGDAFDYFMEVLGREDGCKVIKALVDLGTSKNE